MKRDLELVRKILFHMEAEERPTFDSFFPPNILGHEEAEVIYHMEIMAQANLLHLEKNEVEMNNGPQIPKTKIVTKLYSVSWQGHEFLDALRDESRWKEVKTITSKVGGFAVDVALAVAKEIAVKAALGQIS